MNHYRHMVSDVKKKVLFFLPTCVGGAEKMTVNIAKMLDTSKYKVKFVFVDRSIRDITKFIPGEYETIHLKICNIWDFTICKMVGLMRREQPDIVFCSLRYLNPRVILAARIVGGIKSIVRNDLNMGELDRFTMRLIRYAYPKADYIIAQTDQMRKEILDVLSVLPEKVVTLRNPVDTELIERKLKGVKNPYNVQGIKYVATSRIMESKGQESLIKAFAKLPNINECHLFIVGKYSDEDPFYMKLLLLIRELGVDGRVHFTGFTDNPYKWLKYSECFVLSSRREGLPNTLIEASYVGVPVVATRCLNVISDIVKDGYNGYIVEMDDVAGMAEAMAKAVSLKNFKMIYKGASKEEFVSLFQ